MIEYSGVTGAFIQTLGTIPGAGGLSNPEGLTFFGGSLYVASQGNDAVLQYSFSTGQFSTFVQSVPAACLCLPVWPSDLTATSTWPVQEAARSSVTMGRPASSTRRSSPAASAD